MTKPNTVTDPPFNARACSNGADTSTFPFRITGAKSRGPYFAASAEIGLFGMHFGLYRDRSLTARVGPLLLKVFDTREHKPAFSERKALVNGNARQVGPIFFGAWWKR